MASVKVEYIQNEEMLFVDGVRIPSVCAMEVDMKDRMLVCMIPIDELVLDGEAVDFEALRKYVGFVD